MKRSVKRFADRGHTPDWPFLLILLALLFIGVIMVYDASIVTASNVFGGKYHFIIQQTFWVLLGLFGFSFVSRFNLQRLGSWSKPLLYISLGFLIIVLLPLPFSPLIYGARRWFYFNPPPLPSLPLFGQLGFQPAELTKLALVIFFSKLLTDKPKRYLLTFMVIFLVVLVLMSLEPDFGTSMIIAAISLVLLFISGTPLVIFGISLPVAVLLGSIYVLTSPYRKARLLTFLQPSEDKSLTSAYHIQQILIALGSGGLSGLGLGQSRQKYGFIPEVQTDSIFAIVGEEFGLIGTTLLILLFFLLIWRGFKIASLSPDRFHKYLAVGFTSWLAIQVLINLGAMTHLIPLTGIPLPLISYGGSSMVFLLAGLGVVFNVSRHTKKS